MSKNDPRSRRPNDTSGTAPSGTATTTAVPTNGSADGGNGSTATPTTTATAAQQARQRILAAATIAADPPPAGIPSPLVDTFLDERNDVLTVINELEDQLDRHQEIRESVERELAETSEKLQAATQKVQELEWQAVTLQTRIDALEQGKGEVTQLEEELADVHARAQRVTEQLESADKDKTRLKNELKTATRQLEELWAVRKERDGLKIDCKSLSTKLDELERSLRDATEERAQTSSRITDLTATLDESRAQTHQLSVTLRTAEDRIAELTRVQEALTDKVEAIREEKKTLQATIAHQERENARLIEQRQYYECELTSLRNMNRTAETALASVKKAFGEVRIALSEAKARVRRRTIDTWPRIGATLRTGGPADAQVLAQATDDGDLGLLIDERLTTTASTATRTGIPASVSVGGILHDET